MSDKEKNKNLENRTSNPQNNAGSFPNKKPTIIRIKKIFLIELIKVKKATFLII